MAVGELFLAAFLQVLFDRLASRELMNFAFGEGVGSKLKKWERTLEMIQALLKDAEEKQLTEKAVKTWLDDLQDLAYDVEDILDEFATQALRRKLMAKPDQASSSKVRSLIPACFNTCTPSAVKFNVSMGSKINDITSRLEQLYKLRTDLGLKKIAGGSSTAAWERLPPTTCLPTEPAVYGRDEDKANILKMMSPGETCDAKFLMISIVGMGGLGKTTLARLLYNDRVMEDFKFDMKAWVCVSDDFDVLRISKAILESITLSSCDLNDLNQIQLRLKDVLQNKRFLLVLDDVWSSNYGLWETLKSPFKFGASGSKIIVTTRDENVALTISPDRYYSLKLLSNDDCWSVFAKHAFQSRDIGACPNLEVIRDKVVKNCKGLPLAARTLGGLLHSKKQYDEWNDIFNSKIWDLPSENEIPPVLKLSYHHLPSHLKRCFAACAILPKDYEFEEKELVLLWMAESLIQESKDNKQQEDLGSEYFRDLLLRSIFQQSNIDNSKFVMHDLINDLAQWASGESSLRLEDLTGTHKNLTRVERVRRFSYISLLYNTQNKFEMFHELEHSRTFLPISLKSSYCFYIPNIVLSNLLLKFKKLRYLSLRKHFIVELPNSIGVLKHLRYLNLSYTVIKYLPESTSSLSNLQSLLLRGCSSLKKLPLNMRHLINLRHLDIRGANLIKDMPLGIEELGCLQTLSNFIIGRGTGSSVRALKDMKFLRGELHISRLENVIDSQDIGGTILRDKIGIKVLSLDWGSQNDNSRNEIEEKNLLEVLRPHEKIKELKITGYSDTIFPSWTGDSSFSNMVVLQLENCAKCECLPSLGQLSALQDVTIKGMKKIKNIGSEVYGESCSKPFQFLKTLRFEDMQEWENWGPIKENEDVRIFPRLCKLSVIKCPKLIGRLPDSLPSLTKLVIQECAQLVVSCSSIPVHSHLDIAGSNPTASEPVDSVGHARSSVFANWLTQGYQQVHDLSIVDCEKLINLWQNEISLEKPLQEFNSQSFLDKFCVQDCPTLVSFPEIGFSIRELRIVNCEALPSLPEGIMKCNNTSLQRLEIKGCHNLAFIIKGQLPLSLKELLVKDCKKLQFLVGEIEDTSDSSASCSSVKDEESIRKTTTSCLEYLDIRDCPSLKCLLPKGHLPVTLHHLEIWRCSELTTLSSTGQLPVALTDLFIYKCPKLQSVAEKLHNNTSLRSIAIMRCENFNSLPKGLFNLDRLHFIHLVDCPNLVCFPEGGIPDTIENFSVKGCGKLEELPNRIHSFNRLRDLEIVNCPCLKSFPAEGFPSNLDSLTVGDLKFYKALKEWGLCKFTSLAYLSITGCPDAVSFPEEEIGMMLPTSLIDLTIEEFPKLKCLSSKGFRDLTSLKYLRIRRCPELLSFPEEGLSSSLCALYINNCPLLKKQCKKDKGREWSKIAQISYVTIDGKFIYDQEADSE